MNKLRLKGIKANIPVRVTKTKGIAKATEKVGSVYEGVFLLPVVPGAQMRLIYNKAQKWFLSSPVISISHGETATTVKTMHSTYKVEAI
jgi:hypothetical protein